MTFLLGFDFYGSGNVGDDLMLAGFLDAYDSDDKLIGTALHVPSQQRRFGSVAWSSSNEARRAELLNDAQAWIGVGDTPFQGISGAWFVNALAQELPVARSREIPAVMLGIGAETEASSHHQKIDTILKNVDLIWTRDQASADILLKFGGDRDRVRTGADLSHIALSRICRNTEANERPYHVGIGYYSESARTSDISAIADFTRKAGEDGPICYISNEFRPYSELATYIQIFQMLGDQRRPRRLWRAASFAHGLGVATSIPIFMPDYLCGSLAEFIEPYQRCKAVLTSRYHGVIAAAWAGCRVGILGGRSSKLDALAIDFDIPMITPPYTRHSIERLAEGATFVRKDRLLAEAQKAKVSVTEAIRYLEAQYISSPIAASRTRRMRP